MNVGKRRAPGGKGRRYRANYGPVNGNYVIRRERMVRENHFPRIIRDTHVYTRSTSRENLSLRWEIAENL